MAEVTVESVLEQVRQLPVAEQRKLRDSISLPEFSTPDSLINRIPRGRRVPTPYPQKDRSREMAWLAQHQAEYAGQWVALEGDELLAHGDDLLQVAAEAKAKGEENPIFARAEDPNAPPFAGWP